MRRIRPTKIKIELFLPPRGAARPAIYSVTADGKIVGELRKYADTGKKKTRWKLYRWAKEKSLGSFLTKESAVRKLLSKEGKDHCPFVIDYDPGWAGMYKASRQFEFVTAYYAGDTDDGVYFRVEMNPADNGYYVDVVVASETAGENWELAIRGPFKTYQQAGEAGLKMALDWLEPRGVPVDEEDVKAIRADLRSRTDRR